eukprot:4285191-Heterocapsa_arctica.AAC.1
MGQLDVQVPSAWKLWLQSSGCLRGKPSNATSPSVKVTSVWSGLKRCNGRAEDPVQDKTRR